MSLNLEEIRKKIDSLDDRIHDLLMERADLIVDVSREKKKNNIQIVQPAREATMIRRLLKRHRAPLPELVIIRIWRELVGAVSLLQTGLKVSVSAGDDHAYCWDMAKEYFGGVLPMVRVAGPLIGISSLRDEACSFAVLPWPQDGEAAPWWPHLANAADNDTLIVCALPYDGAAGTRHRSGRALVVARTDFLASGDDNSFMSLEIDPSVSRARVMDKLKNMDMEILSLNTVNGLTGRPSLHFIEVKGYVRPGDERLNMLAEKFDALPAKVKALGGYPVLPMLADEKTAPLSIPAPAK